MHQQKHTNKLQNLSKVNNKDTRMTSIDVSLLSVNVNIGQILDNFLLFLSSSFYN